MADSLASESSPNGLLTAVCLGSTGAIGRALVRELLASPRWARVVLLARRRLADADVGAAPGTLEAAELAGRLVQVVADTAPGAAGYAPHAALLAGADAAFCTVGAPRGAVGSAAEYARVNRDLPLAAAALCRAVVAPAATPAPSAAAAAAAAAGAEPQRSCCRHFSLVSTVGANARSALPYLRLKGEVEAALAALRFESLAVWRPGLLQRGELASTWQRVACALLPSMPVATVARAMRAEAEAALARPAGEGVGAGALAAAAAAAVGAAAAPLYNADILARAKSAV